MVPPSLLSESMEFTSPRQPPRRRIVKITMIDLVSAVESPIRHGFSTDTVERDFAVYVAFAGTNRHAATARRHCDVVFSKVRQLGKAQTRKEEQKSDRSVTSPGVTCTARKNRRCSSSSRARGAT